MWVSAASWPPGNTGDRWIPVDQTTKGARHEQKRRKPGRRRQARRRKAWRRQARRRTPGRESAKCPQQEREPVGRRARQQSTALAVIERRSGSVDRGTASPPSCRLSIRVVSPCLRGAWCGCNGCLRREMGEPAEHSPAPQNPSPLGATGCQSRAEREMVGLIQDGQSTWLR